MSPPCNPQWAPLTPMMHRQPDHYSMIILACDINASYISYDTKLIHFSDQSWIDNINSINLVLLCYDIHKDYTSNCNCLLKANIVVSVDIYSSIYMIFCRDEQL